MILDFKLTANRDKIVISAPQVELELEIRDLVGYHAPTGQIVSIGDTPEEMRQNAPQYWERHGRQIQFVHPFDFDEAFPATGAYEPLIAVRVIQWFSNRAFGRMKRQSLRRILLSPWVDRVDYSLQLEGFEKLPDDVRRQFVRYLKKLLVAVRRVEINGVRVAGR